MRLAGDAGNGFDVGPAVNQQRCGGMSQIIRNKPARDFAAVDDASRFTSCFDMAVISISQSARARENVIAGSDLDRLFQDPFDDIDQRKIADRRSLLKTGFAAGDLKFVQICENVGIAQTDKFARAGTSNR